MATDTPLQTTETRTCPFAGCDWTYEAVERISADYHAEMHYEREHAGRVRTQVTLEYEQRLGPRDPSDVSATALDRWRDKDWSAGVEVAHTRAEVIEEASDYSRIENNE